MALLSNVRAAPISGRRHPRVAWHLNRLRCMTPAEIPFRIARLLTAHLERLGLWGRDAVPSPAVDAAAAPWIHRPANVDATLYLAAADRILAGRFDLFTLRDAELGTEPRWNRDPKTGRDAPLSFGPLLNYRDTRLVGDIKYLWELNRHMHLVTLAQAQLFSRDGRYGDALRRHLETWFIACPYLMGPNWASALEAAVRLINWSAAWQLLGGSDAALFHGSDGAAFRDRWLASVHQHVRFIRAHYSRYSSANNHLIGEAAGVYVAAATWPCWPGARRWASEAAAILEREVLKQNAPDGVNREQAVAYQLFELDLLLLTQLAARARGDAFSRKFHSRMTAMFEFLASIMDAGGRVPMIGDSDDGYVVRLSQEAGFCPYRSVLAAGALLCQRTDFGAKAGRLDDKTRWLFGPDAATAVRGGDAERPPEPKRAFRDGGYYILGRDFDSADEIRIVADAGPLGYNTICAHGHADALAFTLSSGGREVFVDPGTGTYLTDDPWRAYFRGTAAHNTLRVDGLDQSQPGGTFMWLRKARCRCTEWETSPEQDVFEAWHDGYRRLPDPVIHRRRITLHKRARRITIEDRLDMTGTHDIELFFHLSEQLSADPLPGGFRIRTGGPAGDWSVELRLPRFGRASHRVHYGSVSPVSGWISRRFDEKQPAPTIVWRARLRGHTSLLSEIRC